MIGVYGGTFDPVHYGHLRTALEVKDEFGLESLHMLPCGQPPHRSQTIAPAAMRAEMVRLGIAGRPGLLVDARELERPGPSYMIDTLKSLRYDFPGENLLLFIGTDAFNHLESWYRWQQLFDYAHLVVMTRPGFHRQPVAELFQTRLTDNLLDLAKTKAGKLHFHPVTQLDISATAVRALFAGHRDPGFLLPDAVIDYIRCHRLYGS